MVSEYIRRVFEGEAPCDKCEQAARCKQLHLACSAFSFYVKRGTFELHTPRYPTNYLFNLIFRDDDIGLKNYYKNSKKEEND